MGPTVCSLSPLLLPRVLRCCCHLRCVCFNGNKRFVARRELLDVQNGVVGCLCLCDCCVCVLFWLLAIAASLATLLFLQTVFSNFLKNVLYVFVVELIIRAKVEGEDTEKLAMIFF
jgi:hypothetical protein